MRQYAETGLVALDLANTWDEYLENPERLPDLTALERFLKELGGERSDLRLRASDLEAVRAVRDRLRVVLGSVLEERTSALARWVSDAAPGVLVLEVEGAPRLRPTVKRGAGLADRLAVRAMAELLDLAESGVWQRLRQCAADPCRDAFVDRSRPGLRQFCSTRCANRAHAAASRSRRR